MSTIEILSSQQSYAMPREKHMKQKINLISVLNVVAFNSLSALAVIMMLSGCAEDLSLASDQRIFPVPMPNYVKGVESPIVSLNGTWRFSQSSVNPQLDVADESVEWSEILVPGEPFMQGYSIDQDREFYYQREIAIPLEFEGQGQAVFLRFDGVYSYARVFIDGDFVGEHTGGFTAWNINITSHIEPGTSATLTVAVIDSADDISRASFYAQHNIGGILRDVWLFALPSTHLTRLHLKTDIDENYKDAILQINASVERTAASDVSLALELVDASGNMIAKSESNPFPEGKENIQVAMPVIAPKLWDAEHPNLYQLRAELFDGSELIQVLERNVGFRDVELAGEQLLVNGKPVKLRGINRHSIHPSLGRTDTAELDARDIELFREANVNFIRTSHYPPTQRFLELADQYGMYLEVEAPITWWNAMEDSSAFTERFLGQTAEMVDAARNHASVVIWSIGNESFWDENFRRSFEDVKDVDSTRPVIWSYAPPAGPTPGQYEIYSEHYPEWDENLDHKQMPILLDEYAHVNSYAFPVMQRDPGIRDFWGDGFSLFWDNLYQQQHVLGAAIWGGIDEVFYAPNKIIGYGQWGIVDTWRRKKPEFWLTRKAYSPIRLGITEFDPPAAGEPLRVPVQNRFDHTNLQELNITWSIAGEEGAVTSPDVAPRMRGWWEIPGRAWVSGDRVGLTVTRSDGFKVDEFELGIGKTMQHSRPSSPLLATSALFLNETDGEFTVDGQNFSLIFDKQSGKIRSAHVQGEKLITDGPDLILTPVDLQPWALTSIRAAGDDKQIHLEIVGSYGNVDVQFDVRVLNDGAISIDYAAANLPSDIEEIGVQLRLSDQMDTLNWHRQAKWSVYPDDHIGRPIGTAYRKRTLGQHQYGQPPQWPWSMDTKDYFLFGANDLGRASNDFRSTKTNIYSATATIGESGFGLQAESDGSHAVRMGTTIVDCRVDDEHSDIVYHGEWVPYEDGANCRGTEHYSNEKGATVGFRFFGDSVKWLGPTHYNLGKANVFIDGELVAAELDLYSVNKIFQQILFEKNNLELGWHRIEIAVSGEKNKRATDTFVVVDGFHYSSLSEQGREADMNILSDWSYDPEWGNYAKKAEIGSTYGDTIRLRLSTLHLELQ